MPKGSGHGMLDLKRKLILVHIQKTGGTSVAAALGTSEGANEKHLLAKDLRRLYGDKAWDGCFKFAFVRNPWDRLVSWWSMIDGHREKWRSGDPLNPFQSWVLSRAETFEQFLRNCDEDFLDGDGPKWIFRNQLDYLVDDGGSLMVDEVGRFERLQEDFDRILARVTAGPSRLWSTLARRGVRLTNVNPGRHGHYSTYYTPELRDLVGQRCQRDIVRFGYRFEGRPQ